MKEGNSFSNLLGLIKDHGYNKDVSVNIGLVKQASPLQIQLNGFVIEEDDMFICSAFASSPAPVDSPVLVLIDGNDFYIIDKVVE